MLVDENIFNQQKLEHSKHVVASAEQEKLLLQYTDEINNGIMTINEFLDKTNSFNDYWEDVAASATKQKPIVVPKRLAHRLWK